MSEIADLRLPLPLLSPEKWPNGTTSVFSIFAVSWGGPIAERIQRAGELVFELPDGFWTKLSQSSRAVVETQLEGFPNAILRDESSSHSHAKLIDWASAVFPETEKILGEFVFRKQLETYQQALKPDFITLDALRFFPGSLKRAKHLPLGIESLAAAELARVTVLFSPQNEVGSAADGAGSLIIYNPTIEMIERRIGQELSMIALWRTQSDASSGSVPSAAPATTFCLNETNLDWQEAAVFDELRENPRTSLTELLFELKRHAYPLPKTRSFAEVIDSLLARQMLLRRA